MSAIAVFNTTPVYGFVKFWNDNDSFVLFEAKTKGLITVQIHLRGLKPGFHGIHIHECGDLTPSSKEDNKCCESVCNHYNPTNAQHGSFTLHGTDCHAGDLCNNILANSDGKATFAFRYVPGYNKMFDIMDILGRSVVIHEHKDDLGMYRDTDPNGSGKTGNAGNKIACAVIGRMKPLVINKDTKK